jgi:hypothetical protein
MPLSQLPSDDDIDLLLENYLHLLSTYTTLRTHFSTAQSSIHYALARAAFSSHNTTPLDIALFDPHAMASRGTRVDTAGEVHIEERPAAAAPRGLFGVPPALREARNQAVEMVDLVPRIVVLDREMRELERRIWRARKARAKEGKAQGREEGGRDGIKTAG